MDVAQDLIYFTSCLLLKVDQNSNGGWIMLFVREGIPSKLLSVENWNKAKKKEMFTQLLLQSK